jgi:uncharacterized protein
MQVVALYRYPVKGFTPEACETLRIITEMQAGGSLTGRVAGDRVLGFRFADTPESDDAWSSKHGMLALVNTPGLARLHMRFDEQEMRLRIHLADPSAINEDTLLLADEMLDEAGRRRLCEAVADYAMSLEENGLKGHPERLPLRLVGDGITPRYSDKPAGGVSLHSRASLEALGNAMSLAQLSEVRFRSNIAIDGVEAWEELAWEGRSLRIGDVPFHFEAPKVRCLATHANPVTGVRDMPVMTTLTRVFSQEKPTFAVGLMPLAGGEIHVGDRITIEN